MEKILSCTVSDIVPAIQSLVVPVPVVVPGFIYFVPCCLGLAESGNLEGRRQLRNPHNVGLCYIRRDIRCGVDYCCCLSIPSEYTASKTAYSKQSCVSLTQGPRLAGQGMGGDSL